MLSTRRAKPQAAYTSSLVNDDLSFLLRQAAKHLAQAARHSAGLAVADGAAIDLHYWGQFAHSAGAEHLVGPVHFCQRQVLFTMGNGVVAANLHDGRPRDAFRASV